MIVLLLLALGLITILRIYIYKMAKKVGCKKRNKVNEFYISSATMRDGTCRLFETDKGKVAVCREKDKIKIFSIDESDIE